MNLQGIERVLIYYILSALFYKNAGEHKSHSLQLTKILYVLREYIAIHGRETVFPESFLRDLKQDLVSRAIRGVYRSYESTHRLEIEKLQEIFGPDEVPTDKTPNVFLKDLSIGFELHEIIVVTNEIEIKMASPPVQEGLWLGQKPYFFSSPYSSLNSIYNRIHELRYRAQVNYWNFRSLGFADALRNQADLRKLAGSPRTVELCRKMLEDIHKESLYPDPRLVMEFLITDSIFCYHDILRALRIYGISYMANHSMLAAAHEKMAVWCARYCGYLHCSNAPDEARFRARIQERLEKLIGSADLVTVMPTYHNELALVHYRSALEVHSEGRSYREIIEKMFYLNDDLNDKLSHVCAALERYRVNSGKIEERIKALSQELLGRTTVYEYSNYFSSPARESAPLH